jgi:hypothetical protein
MTTQFVTGRRITLALSLSIAALGLLTLGACADSGAKDPADASRQRQEELLSNPMAAPQMDDPDLTGGGFGDFHDKSFQRDVDNALN